MPYCTIQEAWGNSFGKKPKKIKKYKIEENEMANNTMSPLLADYPGSQETLFKKKSAQAKNIKPLNSYVANTGSELSNEFIEDLYQKKTSNKLNSQYSLENAAQFNMVASDAHLQKQYRKYIEYIEKLEKRIQHLEKQLEAEKNTKKTSGIYNIVLYIFAGIFIIFVLDCFVRLGKCLNTHGGLGATLKLDREAISRLMPQNLPIPRPSLDAAYFQPVSNFAQYSSRL